MMQYTVIIKCEGCGEVIAAIRRDTAFLYQEFDEDMQKQVLIHRQDCEYYNSEGYRAFARDKCESLLKWGVSEVEACGQ